MLPLATAAPSGESPARLTGWAWVGLPRRRGVGLPSFLSVNVCPVSSLAVRLHDSISEEGFHYLVFDL